MNYNDPRFLKMYELAGLQNPIDFHIAAISKNIDEKADDFLVRTGRTTNECMWVIFELTVLGLSSRTWHTSHREEVDFVRARVMELTGLLRLPSSQFRYTGYTRINIGHSSLFLD